MTYTRAAAKEITVDKTADADRALMRLKIPGRAEHIGEMRRAVASMLGHLEMTEDEKADIMLAFGEACNNAIVHGKGSRNGCMEVVCRLETTPLRQSRLHIDVQNPGNGFHPERDARLFAMPQAEDYADHGRGLPLMRMLMDDVQVLSLNGNTIVRLTKVLG